MSGSGERWGVYNEGCGGTPAPTWEQRMKRFGDMVLGTKFWHDGELWVKMSPRRAVRLKDGAKVEFAVGSAYATV